MPLMSKLFRRDPVFEACLVRDDAHITPGSRGLAVVKIQLALLLLDKANQLATENDQSYYGPLTAAAVRAYKQRRQIINLSYETSADDIVGKMTIARLDAEMLQLEGQAQVANAVRRKPRFGGPLRHSTPVSR